MTQTTEYPIIHFEDYVQANPRSDMGWLAGYPRSGAALVRTVLANCFGHSTGTIYKEASLGPAYAKHLRLGPTPIRNDHLEALVASQRLLLFKTHDMPHPPETVPTVVIVRDGRRTLASLQAFYGDHAHGTYTMTEMIRGDHRWGLWSAWIRAWAADAPDGALWLRYEDIMADRRTAVDQIAAWMDIPPISYEIPTFESMHKTNPEIFRQADVTGNGGMTPEEEDLFWNLHGGTMSMLGYRR